jgi:pimeloyl-ACP methyl ester carboxylesterase
MKNKRFNWGKLGRVVGLVVLGVLLLLYIGLPVGMGAWALSSARSEVGAPPQGFQDVTLTTEDGVSLAVWYRPAENGSTIIVIHGSGDSREGLRGPSEMLKRHGYGVLALDLRGHGESSGRTNRFGWESTADVGAAVAYLQAHDPAGKIGGWGFSLGGETLLGAAGRYPQVQAIVSDGSSRRSTQELLALPSERPLARNFVPRVMYAAVGLFSGQHPPEPLLDSMQAAESTRYLLIAAGNEKLEIAFNRLFADTLGERAALWIAPDADHVQAFGRHPEEYERRVIEFFDAALR